MNERYLAQAQAAKFKEMLAILGQSGKSAALEEILKKVKELGLEDSSVEELPQKLCPGKYTKEFDVISGALAYFQVACQRMIDFVPMRIDQHLVYDFSKSAQNLDVILDLVGKGGEERCAELLTEDHQISSKRARLHRRKEILVNASEILASI